MPIVSEIVKPGSVIYTDEWKGYLPLSRSSEYDFYTVNHSRYFVNPENGVHTQAIESYWTKAKKTIKQANGLYGPKLSLYLFELMQKKNEGRKDWHKLIKLLRIN